MQIMFAGEELENEKSLNYYNVQFGGELRLVLTPKDKRSEAFRMVVDNAKKRSKSGKDKLSLTKRDVYRALVDLEDEDVRDVPSSHVILIVVAAVISTAKRFPTFKEFNHFMRQIKHPTNWYNTQWQAELVRMKEELRTRKTRARLKAEEKVCARLRAEEARARLEEEEKRLMTKKLAEVAEDKLRIKAVRVRKERLDKAEEALARADKELSDAEARVERACNAETKINMEKQRDRKVMARDNANDLLQQVRRNIAQETSH